MLILAIAALISVGLVSAGEGASVAGPSLRHGWFDGHDVRRAGFSLTGWIDSGVIAPLASTANRRRIDVPRMEQLPFA